MQPKYSLGVGAAAVAAALTAGLITVSARATGEEGIPSVGEAGSFLLCFYECKRNFDRDFGGLGDDDDGAGDDDDGTGDDDDGGVRRIGDGYWKEVTVLVLANQRNASIGGELAFFDGNRGFLDVNATVLDGPIYGEAFNLSGHDLAEINVCRRMDREFRPQPVPEAGLIGIQLDTIDGQQAFPVTGVYGWVKNVLGEINRFVEDPFNSPVRDVAKTECRVVPPIFQ